MQLKILNNIFGKEITDKDIDSIGILLEEILSKRWTFGEPEKISAYRERESKNFWRVLSLHDILKPKFRKKII